MPDTTHNSATVSNSKRPCQGDRNHSDQRVRASTHAKWRWVQRAGDVDRRPATVWHSARRVDLERPCGFSEVRYDSETETLLCVRDRHIVTVLNAAQEPVADSSSTTPHCAGCGQSRPDARGRCQYCGTRTVVEEQRESTAAHGGTYQ
jgi:hypothetical protein